MRTPLNKGGAVVSLMERVTEFARAANLDADVVQRELGEELRRAARRLQNAAIPVGDREALELAATPAEAKGQAAIAPWLLGDVLFEQMRATAVPIGQAATRLRLSDSALRRVLGTETEADVELLGVKDGRGAWRVFAYQLDGNGGEPGSPSGRRVQRALPPGMHPVAVREWWDGPNAALYLDGEELTPRAWLARALDPDRVVEAARYADAA